MVKQPLSLKEQQNVYLDILKELDRFCTEHDITYYMGCGTLIGAVRHNGFIPWDNDIDVFMPEPDFKRFSNEYHSPIYTLHTCNNDLAHPFTFGLLCDSRLYTNFFKRKQHTCGIDIYIIYGAPSERSEQIKHMDNVKKHIKRKNFLVKVRNNLAKRGLWPFKSLDSKWINKLVKRSIKEFQKYHFEDCDYIWPFGGGRLILEKELYGTPIRLPFEDGLFLAPQHYHEVLTAGYGDYMTLPPEDQRNKGDNRIPYFWDN
ncbi:MAG: LicD family protein [Bacteroidales bacterium]|nr:LicD family protein [Bacteroidales bacterium]